MWNVDLPTAEFYDRDHPRLGEIVEAVRQHKCVAIDTETTGLKIWYDVPLFWSLAFGERRICMTADTLPAFREVFEEEGRDWVLANAKFDAHMLANLGGASPYLLKGRLLDVQVMHAMTHETDSHKLEDLGKTILGWQWKDLLEEWKKDKASMPVGDFLRKMFVNDPQKLIEYASNDAYATLRVYEKLRRELEDTPTYSLYPQHYPTMWSLFERTEAPFTKVLWQCERNGILIDDGYLKKITHSVDKTLAELGREIVRRTGRMINPNSPQQMRDYFIKEKGLRPLGYTDGGKKGARQPKCNVDFLDHYAGEDDVAALLLEYREVGKLRSTYSEGLRRFYDGAGRIHSTLHQDVARTGRLSSRDPNLQNIPNAEEDIHEVRAAFIAPPGYKLIASDYQALEARLLAAAAGEQDMINIFLAGKDIHMGNASLVFGLPYDDIVAAKKKKGRIDDAKSRGLVPDEQLDDYDRRCLHSRQAVKVIGFGLNYGMKEGLLSRKIGCSKEEALDLIDRYMNRYPAVKKFYAEAIEETRRTGYAFSLLGRRRFLPEILSSRKNEAWQAERQAVNMQIQGTAADVARMAMIKCHAARLDYHYGCRMLLQVHDELVFECPEENCQEAMEEIQILMENALHSDLPVPLTTSAKAAKNWALAK